MNKNCAFTICTRSYIGLADTLRNSFLKYNENFDFYVVFCDFEDSKESYILNGEEVVSLGKDKYLEMAFKYNVTEFCTAIKPFGFSFFFQKNYDTVAYLDPDIMFFSRFNELYEDYSVFLTPHILNVTPKIKNDWGEESFLKYGVYNCGFVGLKNDENGRFVANWWGKQLLDKAFSDPESGLYTDQKWMDMVPGFIPLNRINIIKNMGCDLAPWNFSERKIELEKNTYKVRNREQENLFSDICFVHYSAYDYKDLIVNKTIKTKYSLTHYEDTDMLLFVYRDSLIENNTLERLDIKYKFNYFDNGYPIMFFHRRLFRELLENGISFVNPFSSNQNSYFYILNRNKMIVKNDYSHGAKKNIKGYSKKDKIIDKLFLICFKLLGINRYILFLRKISKNARYENNLYLLKK